MGIKWFVTAKHCMGKNAHKHSNVAQYIAWYRDRTAKFRKKMLFLQKKSGRNNGGEGGKPSEQNGCMEKSNEIGCSRANAILFFTITSFF